MSRIDPPPPSGRRSLVRFAAVIACYAAVAGASVWFVLDRSFDRAGLPGEVVASAAPAEPAETGDAKTFVEPIPADPTPAAAARPVVAPAATTAAPDDATAAIASGDEAPAPEPVEPSPVSAPPAPIAAGTVTISVPRDVKVRDKATFLIGKTVYRLASIEGIVQDPCGSRTRCKRRPMRSLKQSIAGASLVCSTSAGGGFTVLAGCSKAAPSR